MQCDECLKKEESVSQLKCWVSVKGLPNKESQLVGILERRKNTSLSDAAYIHSCMDSLWSCLYKNSFVNTQEKYYCWNLLVKCIQVNLLGNCGATVLKLSSCWQGWSTYVDS